MRNLIVLKSVMESRRSCWGMMNPVGHELAAFNAYRSKHWLLIEMTPARARDRC